MITVSQQQAGQRWDIITPSLREALFSDVNADFVWNLCQSEHLPEDKSYQVAEFAGYVLLGFLHPEDLSGELASSLNLPTPLAKTISDQINSRVFAPLRADIDKVYSPLSRLGDISIGSAPKILQDIDASPKHDITLSSIAPSTPKPTTLSDIGWSKQPAIQPITSAKTSAPIPTPPAPPKPAVEPAPMMLHEDTVFKSAEKNMSFTLSKPGDAVEMNMNRGAVVVPAPARPAVLEFGGATAAGTSAPKPPAPTSSTARAPGFGSSLASMSTTNTGARNVSQIVPTTSVQIPKSPTSPMPPQPPQASPAPQPNKSIVKDFL
ncbi:MAG: hypothetical protein ABR884_00200 [Minisyncoccia bacterium]|jgi:hypothetical protein